MSLFQNKFQNAYINTTANSLYLISSTYQSDNSLVNKGKTEFENNVVFDQKVAIGKATDAAYALDVSGAVRINGGTVPILTDDLVFLGNLQATKPVGIGKVYDAGYALDISGNVRIANGNLTGGGVVSVSNQNTFTANQTFSNPVGIGKVWDSTYALDISGNVRIANGNLTGGGVVSVSNQNTFTANQTFSNPVGFGKVWNSTYALDISGNVRIANGNLTGGGVASVSNQNTFTANQTFNSPVGIGKTWDATYALDVSGATRITGNLAAGNVPNLNAVNTFTGTSNRFTKVNVNRANDSFYTGLLDVSGNARFLNGTVLFTNPPTLQSVPTLTNNAQLTHKYYVDETVNELKTSNNTWTGEQTFDGDVYLGLATFSQAPIISVVPEQDTQAANKLYVDTVAGSTGLLDSSNVWTEKQTFETNVDFTGYTYVIFGPDVITQIEGFGVFAGQPPQCNQLATSNAQLTNKQYVDTKVSSLLSSNNTWSNFNTFQDDIGIQGSNATFSVSTAASFLGSASFANPPTCGADPVNPDDLCRKSYVDVVFDPSYNQLLDYTNQQIDERGLYPLGDDNYRFLSNLTGVVAGNRNSAYGFGAGNGIIDGSYNVCLGYNAGQNVGSATNNCIFLGSNSGAFGGTYTNSIAIGSNVSIAGSNQIRIGTTAHTTEIRGEVALRGQTLYSIVDVSQNITIGANGYLSTQFYAVDISGTITANFFSTPETKMGQTTTFRRVGGNTSAQVLSASSNIYPLNSFTQTNVILDANEYIVRITRLRNSAGTGGWYKM
jgi:hypothetical protein